MAVLIRDKAGRVKRTNPRTAAALVKLGRFEYQTTAIGETPVLAPVKKVAKAEAKPAKKVAKKAAKKTTKKSETDA